MKMRGPTGDFNLSLSDLKLNLAPDILELVQSLQSSVLEPLVQPAPDRCAHRLLTTACFKGSGVVVPRRVSSACQPTPCVNVKSLSSMLLPNI